MTKRAWSESELDLLKRQYPERPTVEIATRLGRGLSGVYQMANKLGLQKSEAFKHSDLSGRLVKGRTRPNSIPFRFAKGQVPFNKGLRRPGWGPGRMKETQFVKGSRTGTAAQNWKPIGTIAADTEGYLRIKVRDSVHGKEASGFGNTKVWPLYNRYLWEQAHGPIPPKHLIKFKDGNRANCVLDNLELVSMADNCRSNSMWARLPKDLAHAIQLNGALKRKIRRLTNGKEQE